MSYILNALRKSERERQQNQEQNLTTQLQNPNPSHGGIRARWLVLLVVLNTTLMAYVLLFKQDIGGTSPPAQSRAPKQPAAIAESIPLEPNLTRPLPEHSETPVTESRAAPGPETIAGLIENKKPKVTDATPTKAQNKTGVKHMPAAERSITPDSQAVRVEERDETDHIIDKATEVTPKHEAKPPAAPKNASASDESDSLAKREINEKDGKAENDTPWLEELPASFRRHVPELDINVYVYSERAENRFIMVDMHKYLTGQEIGPGMQLKDILQDGIVVEYRGRRFKIRRD